MKYLQMTDTQKPAAGNSYKDFINKVAPLSKWHIQEMYLQIPKKD